MRNYFGSLAITTLLVLSAGAGASGFGNQGEAAAKRIAVELRNDLGTILDNAGQAQIRNVYLHRHVWHVKGHTLSFWFLCGEIRAPRNRVSDVERSLSPWTSFFVTEGPEHAHVDVLLGDQIEGLDPDAGFYATDPEHSDWTQASTFYCPTEVTSAVAPSELDSETDYSSDFNLVR